MFDFLRRKKNPTPPTAITVEEYMRDGWQTNVDNGVCDIYAFDGTRGGQLRVVGIEPHKEGYRLTFDNYPIPLDYYPQIHKVRLTVVYRQAYHQPETLPEEITPLIGVNQSMR